MPNNNIYERAKERLESQQNEQPGERTVAPEDQQPSIYERAKARLERSNDDFTQGLALQQRLNERVLGGQMDGLTATRASFARDFNTPIIPAATFEDDEAMSAQIDDAIASYDDYPTTAERGAVEAYNGITDNILNGLERDNQGRYVYNGVPYEYNAIRESLYPVVASRSYRYASENVDGFMQGQIAREYGRSYQNVMRDYLDRVIPDLEARIREMRDEIAEEERGDFHSREAFISPEAYAGAFIGNQASVNISTKPYDDLLERIASIRDNDFSSGFDEGFDWANVYTLGLADLGWNIRKENVLSKVENGEALTQREQLLFDLMQFDEDIASLVQESGYQFSLGNKVGTGLGVTTEMALPMVMTMGATNGIGTMGRLGSWASAKVALRGGVKATARFAGRNALTLGRNVGLAYARGAAAAPFMPSTWAGYTEERLSQYRINEDGSVKFTPKNDAMMFLGAYIDSMNEITSEHIGVGIGDIITGGTSLAGRLFSLANRGTQYLSNKLHLDRVGQALHLDGLGRRIERSGVGRGMREVVSRVDSPVSRRMLANLGYAGAIAEPLSEIYGDLSANAMRDLAGLSHDYSQFSSPDYWLSTALVSTLYGGALTLPGRTAQLSSVARLGTQRRRILERISNEELTNKLLSITRDGGLDRAAIELANIDWSQYSAADRAYAFDFVRLNYSMMTIAGATRESQRMAQYMANMRDLTNRVYKDGDSIVTGTDADGNTYYVIDGVPNDVSEGSMLSCVDATTGERKTMLASQFTVTSIESVEDVMNNRYVEMFSAEIEQERLRSLINIYEQLESPAEEDVEPIMNDFGVPKMDAGTAIKLTDGREGVVDSYLGTGKYLVRVIGAQGVEVAEVPFYSILSSDTLTQQVQGMMLVDRAHEEASTDEASTDEAQPTNEGSEIRVESPTPELAQSEQPASEVEAQQGNVNVVEDIASVPTREDGSIDYDAIESPEQYAQLYKQEAGSVENAIADTQEMREAVGREIAKEEERAQKASSPNVKLDARKKAEALRQRVSFFDRVLEILTPADEITTKEPIPVAPQVETPQVDEVETMEMPRFKEGDTVKVNGRLATIVDASEEGVYTVDYNQMRDSSDVSKMSLAAVLAEDVEAAEEETVEEDAPKALEVGLVQSNEAARLKANWRKALDDVAKAFGVELHIEREVRDAEGKRVGGYIDGRRIYIEVNNKSNPLWFLVGHEVGHRMKDLAPEVFEQFKQSVMSFIGKKAWNTRKNKMVLLYEAHGKSYDDALIEEEVVADVIGQLVQNENLFMRYAKKNANNNVLMRALRHVLNVISKMLARIGIIKESRHLNGLVDKLKVLMDSAIEAQKRGAEVENNQQRDYLIGERGTANLDINEEATVRLDNLAIAREMEAAGTDAETIKRATGWERGADSLWRYEVDDNITSAMIDTLRERGDEGMPLVEMLGAEHPLMVAYPELHDVRTVMLPYSGEGYGAFIPERHELVMFDTELNLQTLAHELQHAVQTMEGFAVGGSPMYMKPDISKDVANYQQVIPNALNGATMRVDDASLIDVEKFAQAVESLELGDTAKRYADWLKAQGNITYDDAVAEYNRLLSEASAELEDARFEMYERISGEVEARNVARRLGMTPEERRTTLARLTEDVAREDQIFFERASAITDEESIDLDDLLMSADRPKQSEAKDNARFYLIGEQGAAALDMAEEATTRLDNLNIAREMETAGKDAKAIRMATGWERGADGLWRYEIMDPSTSIKDGNETAIRNKIEIAEEEEKDFMQQSKADTKELRERTNAYLAEMREKYGVAEGEETDAMTEEEIAHLQSLTNKEIEFEDYKERRRHELYKHRMALEAQLAYVIATNADGTFAYSTSLGYALTGDAAKQLFRAYPQLETLRLTFVDSIKDGAYMAYVENGSFKEIQMDVNKTSADMFLPYLIHEIQHAIQHIEGFAQGGTPSDGRLLEYMTSDMAVRKLQTQIAEAERSFVNTEVGKQVTKEIDEWLDAHPNFTEDESAKHDELLLAKYPEYAEHLAYLQTLPNLSKEIRKPKTRYEAYQRLAGEVEARNVSARINMTPEERRATLLSETEDVAREDQIFLRKGAEMAMAKGVRLPKEEYAKLSSTIMTRQYTYGRPSFDYAFTDRGFYVYDYLGDGVSIVNFAMPIVGNEEIIDVIYKAIDNGTINSPGSLDTFIKEIQSGKRGYPRNIIDAIKKRRGYKGLYIYGSRGQIDNSRRVPASGKGSRGSIARRGKSGNSNESGNQELDYRYSLRETDPEVLDKLNNGKTIKVYRAMQVIDGNLYPPMSARVGGKLRVPIALGEWERAEERPDLADDKGYFKLDKGNSTSLKARYNPYIHTSLTPLNDQFSSAQDRPNLVTVEVEIPESELTSGYKAEKAKDAVGKLEWKAGVVQSQLTGTRTVILSRWDRPLRIVPDSEVAQRIVEMFGDTKVVMPSNVVTPSLRKELEKLGVAFRETDNQGKPRYSLITPEIDASYLDAVERGDMEAAQRMVLEAAKLAMPDTKVVDEDGNPKVVYHGTPNNFNAFSKEMFGSSTDRGIWGNGFYFSDSEQYAKTYEKRGDKQGRTLTVFLNIENPLFISLLNGGNEGAMYFHELMEKHFTDDIYEDATRTDELMSVAQNRLTADIVANGYDGIVVEYTNHIDTEYVAFNPNQIKSADPVTYDDAGNVIPLSERFNPEKEDIRYRLSEETTKIFDAAKAKFGTTLDMREAGYILPDGSMLDFSGRHQVEGDTSFLNGDRTVDHREIADIAYDSDDNDTGVTTDLGDFLDRGAIRIDYNAGAINLNVAPTRAQKDRLKRLIERNDGYVYVDFGKGWDTEHYVEYEAARASRVLGDIDRYFDEGIKPAGNVRFSLQEDTRYALPYIIDMTDEEAYMMQTLEIAQSMEQEASERNLDVAQEIVDRTGWVHLANGKWKYYGDIDLTDEAKKNRRVQRWLESKRAIAKARVRKMYDALIREARLAARELGESQNDEYTKLRSNADKVDYILQGVAREALPIEDQVLVDIALGLRLKWSDGNGKRGLKTELGLESSKREKMGAVTIGATTYLEDYVEGLHERNNGYENNIDDNDIRNAVISAIGSYPSPKAALEELYSRYKPDSATQEAEEGIARLVFERDEALSEIDANHRATMEDFEQNPDKYEREYAESEAWNAEIDLYENTLSKTRHQLQSLENKMARTSASERERKATIANIKRQIIAQLEGDLGRYAYKNDIRALINAVNEAQTTYAMLRAFDKAMRAMYELKLRKELSRMRNLTKMQIVAGDGRILDPRTFLNNMVAAGEMTQAMAHRTLQSFWGGFNNSGVPIAKGVDAETKELMELIHQNSDYVTAMAQQKGDNARKYVETLRSELEADTTLTEEARDKRMAATYIIEQYLEAQETYERIRMSKDAQTRQSDINALTKKIRSIKAEIAKVGKESVAVTKNEGVVAREDELKKLEADLNNELTSLLRERAENSDNYFGSMPDIITLLEEANASVITLLQEGKVELSKQKEAERKHRQKLIHDALADMDGYIDAANSLGKEKTAMQKAREKAVSALTVPFKSIDHLLREMSKYAPNGEGRLWQRFIPVLFKATQNIHTDLRDSVKDINEMAAALFGKSYDQVVRLAETTVIGTFNVPSSAAKDVNPDGTTSTKPAIETRKLTVTQAMYILATWAQEDGRRSLERDGFNDKTINEIRSRMREANPNWEVFMNWVVDSYLPSLRPKYSEAFKVLFGSKMPFVKKYFPLRRVGVAKPADIANEGPLPLPSTVTGSVISRTGSTASIDLNSSFFEVLQENVVEMEVWAEMAPIIKDFNILMSSPAVKNAMNAIREGFATDFRKAAKVATLSESLEHGEMEKYLMPLITKTWAGSKLAFKGYTALKQLSSGILFAGYSTDPEFIGILMWRYAMGGLPLPNKTMRSKIANGEIKLNANDFFKVPLTRNILWAMEHSQAFANRWFSGAAGNETLAKKIADPKWQDKTWLTSVRKLVEETLSKGMLGIVAVDAFTVATGMRAIYDYEVEKGKSRGLTDAQAKELAIFKADYFANKTQQSSEGLLLSPMQTARDFISTTLSTFNNAPFAQGRIILESMRELLRNKEREIMHIEYEYQKRIVESRSSELDAEVEMMKQRGELTKKFDEEKYREDRTKQMMQEAYLDAHAYAMREIRRVRRTATLRLFLNAYLGPLAFNAMAILPYLVFGDDDEKKWELVRTILWASIAGPLSAIPLGSAFLSLFSGYDFTVSGALSELERDINNIATYIRENGFDWTLMGLISDFAVRRTIGLDYRAVYNMYAGIEDMIQNGASAEGVMMAINAPMSQVRLITGDRKDNETFKQYIERLMRLYTILQTPAYDEYFRGDRGLKAAEMPLGMKKWEMREIISSYEQQYRRDVMQQFEGEGAYNAMLEAETEYAQIIENFGWTTRSVTPHVEDDGTLNIPVSGISEEEYRELIGLARAINRIDRMLQRFIGEETSYYEVLSQTNNLRNQFIAKYHESIE